jgi:hypothetical protein
VKPIGRDGDESHNFHSLTGHHPSGNLVTRCGHGEKQLA